MAELQSAYRKVVKLWHPDINHSPEAPLKMQLINEAYSILSSQLQRARYDVGLQIEEEERRQAGYSKSDWTNVRQNYNSTFKPPVRCGDIRANGYYRMGHFYAQDIEAWEDIIANGRTMVTSYDFPNKKVITQWI